jgi:IclR family pca regulon transcriptional regulator
LLIESQAVTIDAVNAHEQPDDREDAPAADAVVRMGGSKLGEAPASEDDRERSSHPTASLRNGLSILSLFSAERRWWRMGEIVDATGLSPFAAHLQITAMRQMNLIAEGPGRRYGLGSGPPDPTVAIRAMGVVRLTRAHLVALQRIASCPVTLAMLDGTELVVVDRAVASSPPRLQMTIDLYRRLPAHATALGKVLLAYLPEHREQALVGQMALAALTPFTITDKQQLLKDLQRVRDRALAVEDREHLPHRRCIAAPVRGAQQRVIAAVGLTIVECDTTPERIVERYSDPLARTAARLSRALRHARLDGSDLDWPRI